MPKGIKVWRWSLKQQHWYPHGHLGTQRVRQAAGQGNGGFSQGYNDGDWAIEVEGSVPPKVTRVKASDVGPHGTLWYFNRHRQWVPLTHRSQGSRDYKPEFLNTLEGEHGEILIDLSHAGVQVDSGYLPYVIVKWTGEREYIQQRFVAVPDDAPVDDDAAGYGQIDDNDPPARVEIDRRAAQAEATARFIDRMHREVTTGNRWELLQSYAQLTPGDPKLKQAGELLVQFVTDLAPAPTPGTLAAVDYWRYIDDIKRAAEGGIDDQGQAKDANAGTLSEEGAQHLHGIGDMLAAGGALAEYLLQIYRIVKTGKIPQGRTGDAQFKGTLMEAGTTATLDVVKLYPTVISGVSNLLKLQGVATEGAQALQAIVPSVPFVGTAVGVLGMARAWGKAVRARGRKKKFAKLLQAGVNSNDMQGALTYAMGKTHRKFRTQTTTAVVAGVSGVGSFTLGMTAVFGAANVWNPIGWTLLGVAAVGGAGIVGYKIYKRVTRKKRYEKRIAKGQPQTPGELAAVLIKIAKDDRNPDRITAKLMLESFGVHADSIFDPNLHETAKNLISRHLK